MQSKVKKCECVPLYDLYQIIIHGFRPKYGTVQGRHMVGRDESNLIGIRPASPEVYEQTPRICYLKSTNDTLFLFDYSLLRTN